MNLTNYITSIYSNNLRLLKMEKQSQNLPAVALAKAGKPNQSQFGVLMIMGAYLAFMNGSCLSILCLYNQ
jgi:hypothetical protein